MNKKMIYMTIFSFSMLAMGIGFRSMRWGTHGPAKVKTIDDYWTETGLGPNALADVVEDDTCGSSRRYFLACANSLVTTADRLGLRISFSGDLVEGSPSGADANERQSLGPWGDFFNSEPRKAAGFPFRATWDKLAERMPKGREASLTGSALNAFLSVFRDPHSYILPVSYYQNVIARSDGSSMALGLIVARGDQGYYFRKVVEGSPAELQGLKRGDWLLAVNGTEVRDVPPPRLNDLLKAAIGVTTSLRILRNGHELTLDVKRTGAAIPDVSWRKLDGIRPVGVLTLQKFSKDSCQDVRRALKEMSSQDLRGLLFDLRDNSGGQMDEAACMVSLFIGPDLPAFRVKYLDPSKTGETYFGTEKIAWTGKVAILINSGTASAAEILAGSLRDYERAVLVGERTFGKGSFQEGDLWQKNSKLAFFQTKGFYYLPSGYSPQRRGLTPDAPVKFRDSVASREEDQYENSLPSPSRTPEAFARRLDLGACLQGEERVVEDPQLSQARVALFCKPVATGGHRDL